MKSILLTSLIGLGLVPNILAQSTIELAREGYEDYWLLRKNGKYGLKDRDSNEVIAPLYDSIFYELSFDEHNGIQNITYKHFNLFVAKQGNECLVIGQDGKELFRTKSSRITVENDSLLYITVDGLTGLYSVKSGWLIPAKYQEIQDFQTYNSDMGWMITYPLLEVKRGDLYSLFDIQQKKEITTPSAFRFQGYLDYRTNPQDHYRVYYLDEGGFLISTDGSLMNTALKSFGKYDQISICRNGSRPYQQNGKWGYLDCAGKKLVEARFEKVNQFQKGLALVQENGKYGIINKQGVYVVGLTENEIQEETETDAKGLSVFRFFYQYDKDYKHIELKNLPFEK